MHRLHQLKHDASTLNLWFGFMTSMQITIHIDIYLVLMTAFQVQTWSSVHVPMTLLSKYGILPAVKKKGHLLVQIRSWYPNFNTSCFQILAIGWLQFFWTSYHFGLIACHTLRAVGTNIAGCISSSYFGGNRYAWLTLFFTFAGHGWDVKSVDWHPQKALLVSGGLMKWCSRLMVVLHFCALIVSVGL
jgi:hypothetical protein